MSDTATAVLDSKPQEVKFNLSVEEVVNQLNAYIAQADKSLGQVRVNLEATTKQVSELQRMELVLSGQRQLSVDLLNKIVPQINQ